MGEGRVVAPFEALGLDLARPSRRMNGSLVGVVAIGLGLAGGLCACSGTSGSLASDASANTGDAPSSPSPSSSSEGNDGAPPVDASTAPEAGTGEAGAEGGVSARPFLLASGGVQLIVTGSPLGLQITPANLAADDDVIEIHQEFYGIPWDAFEAGTAPPAEWTSLMDSLATTTKATGKPVFLSLTMLNGGRDHLAAQTDIESGEVKTKDNWSAPCYDFRTASDAQTVEQAYLRYVAYMIDEFSPHWLNVAVEVNLFFEKCASAAPGLIDVANAAYDAAKAKSPGLVVFPSIQIDHLYGYSKDSCPNQAQRSMCFDQAYAQIATLKRDRFAMSTYPMLNTFTTPADLPTDWFTRGPARAGERPLVAETGWNSSPMVVQPRGSACETVFQGTEPDEAAYLGRVLDAAQASNIDVVNWWSDRDLVDARLMTNCPCTFDSTWCAVLDIFRGPATDSGADTQLSGELSLKAFGVMGLRTYDGTLKPTVSARWQAARAP
jgi:hypothetical protein